MPTTNEKALHNATNAEIPKEVELFLSLGPKFALPHTSLLETPFFHLIADIEQIIRTSDNNDIQESTRCRVVNNIQNFLNNKQVNGYDDHRLKLFKTAEMKTKQFFKTNETLLALKADKGNKTVLMEREMYHTKMKHLLSDETTYEKLKRNPTSTFQTKNNDLVKRLEQLNLLDKKVAAKLRTYKAVCPKIYGQPKAHKAGLPLRPVVPCMTAPTYELSKFIGKILQQSIASKYAVKNSYEFCQYVSTIAVPPGHMMISFDVVSLFTCIPIELVRKSVINHWEHISKNTPICLDLFLETIEFCVNSSFFCFDNIYYKQKTGLAMGSPIAPSIAEIVVDDLLDSATADSAIPIPHLRKYVDDLFLVLPEHAVDTVLNVFNSQHRNIQFTVEIEKDRCLPFLDMMLYRSEEGTICTDWYMKPIASGRFLNFHSFHPLHQKLNVAISFAKRVSLFSSFSSKKKTHEVIRNYLRLNDYPISLVNGIINRMNEKLKPQTAMEADESKITRSLTNIIGLTPTLTKTLHSEYANVRIASKQTKTIGSLFPIVKDKTPQDEQTNVIYKINCKGEWKTEGTAEGENCTACYIGCTTRKLKQRISQHRTQTNELKRLWDIGYTKQDYAIQQLRQQTALLEHETAMDHLFDIDKAEIIDRCDNEGKLLILESCHIKTTKNAINSKKDTENIHSTYGNIFRTICNIRKIKSQHKNTNTETHTQQHVIDTT